MEGRASVPGSQTLTRGLDVVEAIADGAVTLAEISERLGLKSSTTYRLATALVARGYLIGRPRQGYRLGAKLVGLGHLAEAEIDLVRIARSHLASLSEATGDAVHLAVLDDGHALYLAKVPGIRRVTVSCRAGERHPLSSTALGKALMLDQPPEHWRARFLEDRRQGAPATDLKRWEAQMRAYATAGSTFDLEENQDRIRCVAAPIRDAGGGIVAAVSVSGVVQYMSDERMEALSRQVIATARAISAELGWLSPTRCDAAPVARDAFHDVKDKP